MKAKFPLLTFVLFSSFILSASVFQKKACIIKKDGKEIDGYIKFFPYRYTPETIDFCEEEFGTYTRYTAKDLLGFYFEDEKYISANTQFLDIAPNLNKLDTNPKPSLSDSTVFLEAVLEGEKTLYVHKSSSFRYYYLDNEVIKPYIYKFFVKYGAQNKKFLNENVEYKKQLNQNLGCDLDIKSKPKSDYTKQFFTGLYNTCYLQSETQPSYIGKERKNRIKLSAIAGTSYTFQTDIQTESQRWAFASQSYFTPGFALSWRSKNKKNSFVNEFIFLGKATESYYNLEYHNADYYSYLDVSSTYNNTVVWNTYVHFPFQLVKNEFFVNLGLNLGTNTSGESNVEEYDQFYTQINTDTNYKTNSSYFEAGYLIGVGYSKKQFNIELRMSPVYHSTFYHSNKPISRLSLVCSYDLTKGD